MTILNIYGVIMFVPLASAILWMFFEHKTLLGSIKDEYYLFIGYSVLFFTIYLLLGFLSPSIILGSIALVLYIVFYLALQYLRHFVVTETYDLNERMKDVKILGK